MKTQAAVLHAIAEPLEIWDLEIPPLTRGQVLVEVVYSGVCRSQINEIKGLKGPDPYLPHTLGHEGAGVIREIGSDVKKVVPGDHVVLSWIKGQGIEAGGCKYQSQKGIVNSGSISTFLHLAVISENRLIPIPKTFPLREAALLGCAIPTGAGVVFNQLRLSKGDSCAIFGIGGIGLSALLAAKFLGADPLIAIDVSDEKLRQAQLLGATHVINSKQLAPVHAIREWTGGRGAQGVLECAGRAEVMELAFQSTAQTGTCVLAGNLPKGNKIQIDPFDLICGKKIIGSWGGGSEIDRDIPRYLQMAEGNRERFSSLITHEVALTEVNQAIHWLELGQVGRVVLNLSKDTPIDPKRHLVTASAR